jgi:transketolase
MSKMIATRDAYKEALVTLGEQNPKVVVLDADLAKSTMTIAFAQRFPERFFSIGIAEANMTGIAAAWQPVARSPLPVPLRFLQRDALMSKFATPLAIRI